MLGRRGMFESRIAFVAAGLIAGSMPVMARAQDNRPVVKEPTGWFGVQISDQAMVDERGNAFFDSYPFVTKVDPASPAAKAGVQAGDVLLNFNGHDMRGGSVELAKWLTVGAPFVLKIRRNDQTRTLKGRLARRPADWEQKMIVELNMPEIMEGQSASLSRVGVTPRTQMPSMGMVRTRMPSPEPLPSVLTRAMGYGGGVYPFAGAEFTALNADLCDVLDMKPGGVFVTRVLDNSPARNAGLRGGDVILRADSIKVDTPIDLVRAIRIADDGDRSLTLQIVRKHKPGTIRLGW